ncbi:MAG TPA: nucleotidyltransferase family protein [Burkholderiales bacterium]|nr:nucleotidyltransferase family protein [Burkholderiales bacterium]
MPEGVAGAGIASLLAGAWRHKPPPAPHFTATRLDALVAHLRRSGSAALAWPSLRGSALEGCPAARVAHSELVYQTLRGAAYEQRIAQLFTLLREASIDALLLKGRASAAYYAHSGLRPYGDIDLLVRPEDYARARMCLRAAAAGTIDVDLHDRTLDLPGRSFDDLHRRSRVLTLEGVDVAVLGPEDHLALVATHFLRHPTLRPVWLCDVAAALEAIDERFDWTVCAGTDTLHAQWIAVACALARALLGAHSPCLPEALRRPAPPWLVRRTLSEWGVDLTEPLKPFSDVLLLPRQFVHGVRRRWPLAYDAASVYGNPPDAFHAPYQCALMLTRAVRFCGRYARARLRA